MAAAIAASMPEKQSAASAAPTAAPTHEQIPASMAKLMDVEAETPLTTVELDGLVSIVCLNTYMRLIESVTSRL